MTDSENRQLPSIYAFVDFKRAFVWLALFTDRIGEYAPPSIGYSATTRVVYLVLALVHDQIADGHFVQQALGLSSIQLERRDDRFQPGAQVTPTQGRSSPERPPARVPPQPVQSRVRCAVQVFVEEQSILIDVSLPMS